MSERLTRATPADIEVRADARTIAGIAVPFGKPTVIAGRYTESFERGAFARTIRERGPKVKLLAQHNAQTLPIGRATELREDSRGLYGEFAVSKTREGDEVLELVRDGALDALSVGFTPVENDWRDHNHVVRLEVKLHEVSVVAFPAYEDAQILALRSEQPRGLDYYRRRLQLASASPWRKP